METTLLPRPLPSAHRRLEAPPPAVDLRLGETLSHNNKLIF